MKTTKKVLRLGLVACWVVTVVITLMPEAAYAYSCKSKATGNWSDSGTWQDCGSGIPGSGDDVIINNYHTVTLDVDAEVKGITIWDNGTFDNGSRTLTANGGYLTKYWGTFNGSAGTYEFTGNGNVFGSTATTLNNVALSAGADFFDTTRSTIAGTLTINSSGYVAENGGDGRPIYGTSSTLKFSTGNSDSNPYNSSEEWDQQDGTTAGTSPAAPQNVELASSTWVSLNASGKTWDRTADGTLTIGSGSGLILESGDNNALKVEGAVTNEGSIRQTASLAGGSFHFASIADKTSGTAYYGVEITGSPGDTTVTVQGNQECANIHGNSEPVLRCYVIDTASAAGATVRFYYRHAELRTDKTPPQDPSKLRVWRYAAGTWAEVAGLSNAGSWDQIADVTYTRSDCTSGDACYVQISGYTLEDGTYLLMETNPTPAVLSAFGAEAGADGVTVAWETASELGNLGFNLYRAPAADGPWTRLNEAVIPSRAPGSPEGFAYAWLDRGVRRGEHWYRLYGVGLDGGEAELDVTSVRYRYGRTWLPMMR